MRVGMGANGGSHHGTARSQHWPPHPFHGGVIGPGSWWRGWGGPWFSPEVVEVKRDNSALYFLGGSIVLGALILSRR